MPAATAPDVEDGPRLLDFEEIYRQHAPMVYRTARAITGSREEAEDVVQTVFLRVIGPEYSANLPKNPKAYLYRVTVNLSLDVLRARRRRTFTGDIDRLESPPPVATVLTGGMHHRLDEALAQLDARSVQILTLRYVHGYNDAEIARLLGTTRGAMALRLFRLRGRLKRLIRDRSGERR
jgi:RNA polymerase sigma-70 factor (ECF subfamily)